MKHIIGISFVALTLAAMTGCSSPFGNIFDRECWVSFSCPNGAYCSLEGKCLCEFDDACENGMVCQNGACVCPNGNCNAGNPAASDDAAPAEPEAAPAEPEAAPAEPEAAPVEPEAAPAEPEAAPAEPEAAPAEPEAAPAEPEAAPAEPEAAPAESDAAPAESDAVPENAPTDMGNDAENTFANDSEPAAGDSANSAESGNPDKIGFQMKNKEHVGSIDKKFIEKVVRNHSGALKKCYQKELSNSKDLQGSVVVRWEIGGDGNVKQGLIRSTTLKNKKVESCLLSTVKSWRFTKSKYGDTVIVEYQFDFSPAE